MSLTALRTREEELRRALTKVRATLSQTTAAASAAATAERELAAMGDAKSRGAYRDVGAERAQQWRADVEAGRGAKERREALRRDEAELVEELEKNRLAIERAGVRRTVLPMLEGAPAAPPCAMRWCDMSGDGESRACPRCSALVVDPSMLDPAETEAILARASGAPIHRRPDGTILAGHCQAPAKRTSPALIAFAAVVSIVAVVVLGASAFSEQPKLGTDSFDFTRPDMLLDPPPDTPVPRPPLPRPPTLEGAKRIDVSDQWTSFDGSYSVEARLTRKGDRFDYEMTCSKFRRRSDVQMGSFPASKLAPFFAALEDRKPTLGPLAPCTTTGDWPKITVAVRGEPARSTLAVDNCSYAWTLDGLPLDVPAEEATLEPKHEKINDAYRAMLGAMDVADCLPGLEMPARFGRSNVR